MLTKLLYWSPIVSAFSLAVFHILFFNLTRHVATPFFPSSNTPLQLSVLPILLPLCESTVCQCFRLLLNCLANAFFFLSFEFDQSIGQRSLLVRPSNHIHLYKLHQIPACAVKTILLNKSLCVNSSHIAFNICSRAYWAECMCLFAA